MMSYPETKYPAPTIPARIKSVGGRARIAVWLAVQSNWNARENSGWGGARPDHEEICLNLLTTMIWLHSKEAIDIFGG